MTSPQAIQRYVERWHGVARRLKAHSPASRVTTAEAPAKAAEFGVVRTLLLRATTRHRDTPSMCDPDNRTQGRLGLQRVRRQ